MKKKIYAIYALLTIGAFVKASDNKHPEHSDNKHPEHINHLRGRIISRNLGSSALDNKNIYYPDTRVYMNSPAPRPVAQQQIIPFRKLDTRIRQNKTTVLPERRLDGIVIAQGLLRAHKRANNLLSRTEHFVKHGVRETIRFMHKKTEEAFSYLFDKKRQDKRQEKAHKALKNAHENLKEVTKATAEQAKRLHDKVRKATEQLVVAHRKASQ